MFSHLTSVTVVAHQTFAADAVPHVLASAHLSRPLCADLVIARVHLPAESTLVDVVDTHVTVEEAAAGRPVALDGRREADDEGNDDGDGGRHSNDKT